MLTRTVVSLALAVSLVSLVRHLSCEPRAVMHGVLRGVLRLIEE